MNLGYENKEKNNRISCIVYFYTIYLKLNLFNVTWEIEFRRNKKSKTKIKQKIDLFYLIIDVMIFKFINWNLSFANKTNDLQTRKKFKKKRIVY